MKKEYSSLIFGLIIVFVGVVLTGNTLGIWYVDVLFDGWWTMFIIVPAVISVLKNGINFGNAFLILLGLVLLLDSQNIIDSITVWKLILPVALIFWGFTVVFSFFRSSSKGEKINFKKYRCDNVNYPSYSAFLGAAEVKNSSQNLKSVKINALLGALEVDLRDANINEDIIIKVSAILAGVDIYLPNNVEVRVESGTPILAWFSCRENKIINSNGKINIKYTTIMGAIDVK